MSKIISSLLEVILDDIDQMNDIANVLNYLGFSDGIRVKFQTQASSHVLGHKFKINSSNEFINKVINNENFSINGFNKKFFTKEGGGIDVKKVKQLLQLVQKLKNFKFPSSFNFYTTRESIINEVDSFISTRDCLFLAHCGLFKLREVYLEKRDTNKVYSISDASSGEQSVVISFLGIASQIQDNTLVCIDEPEICLHPEWQERYIKLLIDTFSRYKKCHFLIATHSPQVVSNLDSHNCFVLSMDDRLVKDAKELINQSVDFQLANVFKSPGFKNEYLSRIALSIFSKVSLRKEFDRKDLDNYQILISQEKLLESNDPVYDLLVSIKKMHKEYARNK